MIKAILRIFCTTAFVATTGLLCTEPARAYSYAVEAAEPLLDGREAMFQAAESGFWMPVRLIFDVMRPEIEYLDQNEDPGLLNRFEAAVAARDAAALRMAFDQAAADEIIRRLNGARQNLDNYQTAKLLVVAANRFYTAVAANLDPDSSRIIAGQMLVAIDAVGNPGILGIGSRPADPAAFDLARTAIAAALGKSGD